MKIDYIKLCYGGVTYFAERKDVFEYHDKKRLYGVLTDTGAFIKETRDRLKLKKGKKVGIRDFYPLTIY